MRWCRIVVDFTVRQAQSSAFAIGLMTAMAITNIPLPWPLPRYDLLFIFCIGFQALFLALRWETWREVGVLAIFHVVGVGLEWFKVRSGAWSYPEAALLKVAGVPLYSGFMYASIASYMSQSWRRLDLEFVRWPNRIMCVLILLCVYGQFFLPTQTLAIRFLVLASLFVVFGRTRVAFSAGGERLWMPINVALLLIGSAVYMAENFATLCGAWTYPHQTLRWQPVHVTKVVSWTMLMTVSLAIVRAYHRRFGHPSVAHSRAKQGA